MKSTTKKTSPKPRRAHHKKAFSNPKTRKLLAELRRKWDSYTRLERGSRLAELVRLGCTRRGLADELSQSATTIGRNMAPTSKKKGARLAVAAPVLTTAKRKTVVLRSKVRQTEARSPMKPSRRIPLIYLPEKKNDLAATKATDRSSLRSARSESSQKSAVTSGALKQETPEQASDRTAKIIVEFLLDLQRNGEIQKKHLEMLFGGVIPALKVRRKEGGPRLSPADIKDSEKMIAYCRPARDIQQYQQDGVWVQFYTDWVAGIAYSPTRNTKLCALAVEKAKQEAILRFED